MYFRLGETSVFRRRPDFVCLVNGVIARWIS